MRRIWLILLLISVSVLSAGCMLFEEPEKPRYSGDEARAPAIEQPTVAPQAAVRQPKFKEYIQIVWQIPEEKVSAYQIRYGTDPKNLQHELKVTPDEIQRVHHEKYGEVYRYLIPVDPGDGTLYVSIAAVGDAGELAPSKLFEVAPTSASSLPASPTAIPSAPQAAGTEIPATDF